MGERLRLNAVLLATGLLAGSVACSGDVGKPPVASPPVSAEPSPTDSQYAGDPGPKLALVEAEKRTFESAMRDTGHAEVQSIFFGACGVVAAGKRYFTMVSPANLEIQDPADKTEILFNVAWDPKDQAFRYGKAVVITTQGEATLLPGTPEQTDFYFDNFAPEAGVVSFSADKTYLEDELGDYIGTVSMGAPLSGSLIDAAHSRRAQNACVSAATLKPPSSRPTPNTI